MSRYAGARWLRDLRRAVSWHRRLLAAGLAAGAVAATLTVLRPTPPPTVAVLAAAHDLAGGVTVTHADLRRVALPVGAVPAGVLRPGDAVVGRVLAGPARAGEPLTDLRFVGASLLGRYAGGDVVATPVRIADAGAVRLLRSGDQVDVLAAEAVTEQPPDPGADGARASPSPAPPPRDTAAARVVARGVRVVSVPSPRDGGFSDGAAFGEGALVVLATSSQVAAELARAAVTARLSVTVRPR